MLQDGVNIDGRYTITDIYHCETGTEPEAQPMFMNIELQYEMRFQTQVWNTL